MPYDKRITLRFTDVAKVYAADICAFPGVLEDISLHGCRVRFPMASKIDMDTDYTIKVTPARKAAMETFVLIAHPKRIVVNGQELEVGFKLLHSPGTRQLSSYIDHLSRETDPNDDIDIVDTVCEFI